MRHKAQGSNHSKIAWGLLHGLGVVLPRCNVPKALPELSMRELLRLLSVKQVNEVLSGREGGRKGVGAGVWGRIGRCLRRRGAGQNSKGQPRTVITMGQRSRESRTGRRLQGTRGQATVNRGKGGPDSARPDSSIQRYTQPRGGGVCSSVLHTNPRGVSGGGGPGGRRGWGGASKIFLHCGAIFEFPISF